STIAVHHQASFVVRALLRWGSRRLPPIRGRKSLSRRGRMTQARLIPAVAGGTLESPVWSHAEQCLYLIDIPGRELLRYTPDDGTVKRRAMPSEPGALALCESGGLLVALRTGIFHFNTVTAALT